MRGAKATAAVALLATSAAVSRASGASGLPFNNAARFATNLETALSRMQYDASCYPKNRYQVSCVGTTAKGATFTLFAWKLGNDMARLCIMTSPDFVETCRNLKGYRHVPGF